MRIIASGLLLAVMICAPPAAHSQSATQSETTKDQKEVPAAQGPVDVDGWRRPISPLVTGQKSAPAPRHDISGTWDPANLFDGIGVLGANAMPEDGKAEHQPPYTALGLELLNRAKPTIGPRMVSTAETNDPAVICDPLGMPRAELFQLRTTQIIQTPAKVLILYEYNRVWRVIWTDGRELPNDPEPRWFGYSVGKWIDDYTLVVETAGMDERTWLDIVGRPHSDELRVVERFHRVDRDHLDLSMTINDPKIYTKPWVALDKFLFYSQPPSFDVREMICSPSELAEYNKLLGNPASEKGR